MLEQQGAGEQGGQKLNFPGIDICVMDFLLHVL